VIIFFFGIFIGKGIEERRLIRKEEPLVKIPVKPGVQESSAGSTPAARDEITFNDPLPSPVGRRKRRRKKSRRKQDGLKP